MNSRCYLKRAHSPCFYHLLAYLIRMSTRAIASDRPGKLDSGGAEPLLEAGDRLSRDEFERRYQRMPHLKKAELDEGIVYQKKGAYRRNGVLEYLAWIMSEKQLIWWELREAEY